MTKSKRVISVWFDPEGNFLEVIFEKGEGYFRETDDDRVMEKIDDQGRILGFSILGVKSLSGSPLEVTLP